MNRARFAIRGVLAIWLTVPCLIGVSEARQANRPISDDVAIRAILGEARGEGDRGMYAVACAIRNRGHLGGVYGAKAKMGDLTPELWQKASKAWFTSFEGEDVTGGATHWEAVQTFGKPYWAKSMRQTVKIGAHTFYAEA